MSQIGQLFKVLGNNSIFLNYIQPNKTRSEIIDDAIEDEELMSVLTPLVDDVSVIRSKMDIIVGQRMKKMVEEAPSDTFSLFIHKPLNVENVVLLCDSCYLERVGLSIRLVNKDIEMFY
jgi:hypothetical protein